MLLDGTIRPATKAQVDDFGSIIHGGGDGEDDVRDVSVFGRPHLPERAEYAVGRDLSGGRDSVDALTVIRRGGNQACNHGAVPESIDWPLGVNGVEPVVAKDIIDQPVTVVVEAVESLGRLGENRPSQIGMQRGDARIHHANQDTLLGSIDRLRLDVINVDAGGADDISDGLSRILQVPLLAEARIDCLRLRSEVRTGPGHRRLGSQNFAELVRGQRIGRTIIETDPKGGQTPLERQRVLGFDGRDLLGRRLFLIGHEDDPRLEDIRRHRDDVQQAD